MNSNELNTIMDKVRDDLHAHFDLGSVPLGLCAKAIRNDMLTRFGVERDIADIAQQISARWRFRHAHATGTLQIAGLDVEVTATLRRDTEKVTYRINGHAIKNAVGLLPSLLPQLAV
jgi:hypothetical protein